LLQHQFEPPNVSKFLISTQPQVPPLWIAQRVKGRLQHLLRGRVSKPFRRNYSLRSIGSTRREKLDQYLSTQLDHHTVADARLNERLRTYQVHCPEVDLSRPRSNNYAQYWYNLHIVLSYVQGDHELRHDKLQGIHEMISRVSEAKSHLLSRTAIVPDHIHLLVGCRLEEAPQDTVLSYMNNLAYVYAMKAVFRYSYFVGTFSEYDLGVIPRP
jgi:REP element-mobilizing transposase RayT